MKKQPASPRPFRLEEDTPRLRDFLVSARSAGEACYYWHVGDLVWRLFLQSIDGDPQENLAVWETEGGRIAGFSGYYADRSSFDLQVHPEWRITGLVEQMFAWVEQRHQKQRSIYPPKLSRLRTDAGVCEKDDELLDLLDKHGFKSFDWEYAIVTCSLQDILPVPPLPEGFTVRSVQGIHEAEMRSAVHRAAFESKRITRERYQHLMETPGYQMDLDVVAVSPGGQFAAFAMGWMDANNRIGEFEPVGTHPDFRGLGLGRAVLLEGMRRMHIMGACAAIVGPVESDLIPFYRSAGFQVSCKLADYYRKDPDLTEVK